MIGWKELLILLVIVLVVFGAKRLRNIGEDLGSAVKGFKNGMSEPDRLPHDDAVNTQARDEAKQDRVPPRDS